jgi:hypothetical protein
MGITLSIQELKLRIGVNWQGALKQKGVKQTGVKQELGVLEVVGYRASGAAVALHLCNIWRYGL